MTPLLIQTKLQAPRTFLGQPKDCLQNYYSGQLDKKNVYTVDSFIKLLFGFEVYNNQLCNMNWKLMKIHINIYRITGQLKSHHLLRFCVLSIHWCGKQILQIWHELNFYENRINAELKSLDLLEEISIMPC